MSVRIGVSPIAWANDDMPELGAATTLETILGDARAIGFAGVELGRKFPREPAALRQALAPFGLALIGGWYSLSLLEQSAEAEIAALGPHLALLKGLGSDVFIAAETSNAIHGSRATPLDEAPRLAERDWAPFAAALDAVAAYVRTEGLRFAYHFHLGTAVEQPADLDELLRRTSPRVGLVVDTGHAALAGIDAAALIRDHPDRVVHVHLKDVRRGVFRQVVGAGASFLDGVLAGMFTVPGDGDLDFAPVMQALAAMRYDGWLVVEAEQDPAKANPRAYGELGYRSLRAAATAAGLIRG